MQAKALEIRDDGTFIACLAVDMNPGDSLDWCGPQAEAQRYLLRRCGYPCDRRPNVLVTHLSGNGSRATNDPEFWNGRTWPTAHRYIIENWAKLLDGDVVDVEFILGETKAPKVSERLKTPI